MDKKIAFVRVKPFPIPNRILPDILSQFFPEYPLEVIDVMQTLRADRLAFARNLLSMARAYGKALLTGRMSRSEAFYTTPYLFSYVRCQMQERVQPKTHAFTFQIQSLFDGSTVGVPHFVYTDHSHLARLYYPDFDHRKLRPASWIRLERGIYEHAELNFTRSSNISQSLIEQYHIPPEKVECVGVGSNLDERQIHLDNDDYRNKNILFVGIDWKRKGGPDLLAAFKKVLQTHPDAHLTIVGASPEVDGLPNCTVAGRVPVDAMAAYYEKASLFCLPTHMEPFGVVFIEALNYKLPIVATQVGAIPDFVKPGVNGFLVEPGDVDGLATYLNQLLSDPALCQAMGEQAYSLAANHYSWNRVGEKMAASIRAVLNRPCE